MILQKSHKAATENTDHNDDWSQECLEYLFDNEIWLPDFVSLPPMRRMHEIYLRASLFRKRYISVNYSDLNFLILTIFLERDQKFS